MPTFRRIEQRERPPWLAGVLGSWGLFSLGIASLAGCSTPNMALAPPRQVASAPQVAEGVAHATHAAATNSRSRPASSPTSATTGAAAVANAPPTARSVAGNRPSPNATRS
ncbi:MAG: hypothetical protein ACKO3P_11080, partial [Planctomycetaceae bacterium]